MKAVGLIVEYNPFHNGHLYHIEQSKKLTEADYIVCIMSGNFIQRGEPAIINKWARTRMALYSGADLVIELPAVYAMSSAEFFAYGAVKILDSMGIIDCICFGSESGKIDELDIIADVLANEPEAYRLILKKHLSTGISYPAAREKSLGEYFHSISGSPVDVSSIMNSSNNILGIEYLKALKRTGSNIIPFTTCRVGNNYNTEYLTGDISSATAIRKSISDSRGNMSSLLSGNLPEASLSILKEEFEAGRGPVFPENFENLILSFLRKMTRDQAALLPYTGEGIENRILKAAQISGNLSELVKNISTKRYTATRVQRILFSTLTGLKSQELDTFAKSSGPQYIRILGFNSKGRELLGKIKKTSSLPVITKTADFKTSCNPLLKRMLEIESDTTDIYVLGYSNPDFKGAGQEYTQNVIYV